MTIKEIINSKINVLLDFCAIQRNEIDSTKEKLMSIVIANPNSDPQILLDNHCRTLIMQALGE